MRGKLVTVVGLLQAVAVITVLFSVVTVFHGAHHNIELFSHFRLQYLAASVILFVVFAVLRDRTYSIALLGAAALNASFIVPWYFGAQQVVGDSSIKLLHANVFSGNDQYSRLLELIEDEQPDVIFLQEVTPLWLRATRPLQNDYPFFYTEPRLDNFSIAVFSRLALDSVAHIDSPPLGYPTIVATLTVDGEALTLINTHSMVPFGRANVEARDEQLESVADIANQAAGAVLLTGDFNATVWTRAYQALEEDTGLRNTRKGIGILPTWPTFMPLAMIAIDHALVSENIEVIESRTGRHIGSDHLPLVLSVAL